MRDPTSWRLALIAAGIAGALMLNACSRSTPPPATAAMPASAINAPADFVDRVWRVQASSAVEPGMLYAFLSDGTLVITAHGSTPTVGKWKYENGALTMIEQGQSYPTDIVVLSADQFTIRSHNPGPPAELPRGREVGKETWREEVG